MNDTNCVEPIGINTYVKLSTEILPIFTSYTKTANANYILAYCLDKLSKVYYDKGSIPENYIMEWTEQDASIILRNDVCRNKKRHVNSSIKELCKQLFTKDCFGAITIPNSSKHMKSITICSSVEYIEDDNNKGTIYIEFNPSFIKEMNRTFNLKRDYTKLYLDVLTSLGKVNEQKLWALLNSYDKTFDRRSTLTLRIDTLQDKLFPLNDNMRPADLKNTVDKALSSITKCIQAKDKIHNTNTPIYTVDWKKSGTNKNSSITHVIFSREGKHQQTKKYFSKNNKSTFKTSSTKVDTRDRRRKSDADIARLNKS